MAPDMNERRGCFLLLLCIGAFAGLVVTNVLLLQAFLGDQISEICGTLTAIALAGIESFVLVRVSIARSRRSSCSMDAPPPMKDGSVGGPSAAARDFRGSPPEPPGE